MFFHVLITIISNWNVPTIMYFNNIWENVSFSDKNKNAAVLSSECQTNFDKAVTVFQTTLKELLNGNISIRTLEEILKAKDKIISINTVLRTRGSSTDPKNIYKCFEMREKEIVRIQEIREDMQLIAQMMGYVGGV